MQTTTIQHAKLRLSDSNVRKANVEAGLDALAASIAEHGLLQPLIVSPAKGRKTLFDVHAGGRRWRTIGLLIERGVLPKDHAVDVRLCGDEDAAAREISLAENLIREAMLGDMVRTVFCVWMRVRPTAALTQRAGGGRPDPRIAKRCLIAT